MKKILLLLVAVFAFISNINAQTWNMVVTHKEPYKSSKHQM